MNRAPAWLVALAGAAVTLVSACTVSTPILGAGPARPGDPMAFDDALRGARAAGYHAVDEEPEAGRFSIVSRTDRSGATRFVVQCYSDGWISIVVVGPRVQRVGDRLVMHPRLRAEYAALAEEVAGAITLWP